MVVLLAACLVPGPAAAQARLPEWLDGAVTRALKTFRTPGAAVAIVKDGRVLVAKGYGVRRLGDRTPVDVHTLFQIASNTKAFTTACLAILVDSGVIEWDDPVIKYLPDFQLADPWVTREITIRDLLTHRSGLGLGAGDLLWLHSTYERKEIIRRMRAAPRASSFRSVYAYDNVLYAAAGEIVPAVTGQSWEAFVRSRILDRLGMTDARTGIAELRASDPLATPHAVVNDKPQIVPLDTVDNIGPAASIMASVADLAKWAIVQLDSGRLAKGRLWSPARTRELWSAVTVMPIADPDPQLAAMRPNFLAYALGWRLRDYRGKKVVWHTGGLAGMTSRVTLVPDSRLGIVILTNGEGDVDDAITFQVLDHYLGGSKTDWISAFRDASQGDVAGAEATMASMRRGRDSTSGPSLALGRYSGPYTDALYGDATISLENGGLVLRFNRSPAFIGDLIHWQYDTFQTHWRTPNLAEAFVTFTLRPNGAIDHFTMSPVSPLADFSYDYQDLRFEPSR
jgi:CubicO group peptidase (beta-lactamase class C family)